MSFWAYQIWTNCTSLSPSLHQSDGHDVTVRFAPLFEVMRRAGESHQLDALCLRYCKCASKMDCRLRLLLCEPELTAKDCNHLTILRVSQHVIETGHYRPPGAERSL